MEKIKEKINNINMTWKKVIIFAIIIGIYTGIVMLLPFLNKTSFQDIGISYEMWVLFAVIIVVNCKNGIDAMIKCFVFFLISQPIIYIVEILFGNLSFEMGLYYYKSIWLPVTFLTLPGGVIAYYCKKQNVLGSIILGLGNTILSILGFCYVINVITEYPYHLLSAVFCFSTIFLISNCIQEKKKNKIIACIIPFVLLIVGIVIVKEMGLYFVSNVF